MTQYTDIPPELMGKSDPNDLWIKAQLIRIDPSIEHYDTEHSVARATRLLVLELRDKLATPQPETGGPAFPRAPFEYIDNGNGLEWDVREQSGMTLRQYAAIKLKVPDSGTDWLDDMIRKSLRDDFAAKAMQSVIARGDDTNRPGMAEWSYAMADAMLKAREA